MGRAAALALAREGARVVVAARRETEGQDVVREIEGSGGEAVFVATDVTREGEVKNLISGALDAYGRLDVAFNNAGGGRSFGLLADQTGEGWRGEVDLNLTSVFFSMKHEIPAMLENGGGVIVNNASQLGLVGIGGGVAPYVAAKHGVIGLTKAAALEYAQQGVRVNAIAPAGVDTPLFRSTMGATEEGAAMIRGLHPVNRIASPEEVASFVLYLASDDAAFFTGAALAMDGGWTAQ
jgi:NAD(P)-dependent dehydrogenase (short-subunit alcohol dehydrogenase family)